MKKNDPLFPVYKKWTSQILIKILSWILLFTLGGVFWINIFGFTILPVGVLSLLLFVFILREMKRHPDQESVISLVNQQFDSIEFCAELLTDDSASGLRELQREHIREVIKAHLPRFKYPVSWRDFRVMSGVLLIFLGAGFLISRSENADELADKVQETIFSKAPSSETDSVFIKSAVVTVRPPAYTRLSLKESENLNVQIPEGAKATWLLEFEGNPENVRLEINQDSIPFRKKIDGPYVLTLSPMEDAIYSIQFQDSKGVERSSPFHQIQIINDQPPNIEIVGIPQYQRLDHRANMAISFEVNISDDYGLTEGYLVATITKGAGESVKFREQRMELEKSVSGNTHASSMTLRPDDLGMEPGNELYFYVTAIDNKEPLVQQSRTETHFFILRDTADVEFSLQGALGVDLMPDFFRSQLQIILDTEKLIQEKSSLTRNEYNSTSNELGYDQKQLRLKYGQFIGEEEDSGLEVESEEPQTNDGSVGENVLQEFGHDHDHENEEGQLMDKGAEHQHDHEESLDSEAEENPLEAFMHNHEDEETATFFTQTLKSKLRAALTQMWDAELYLRLFEPHKSLPYQYEAQRLLKEIKNHARIYVQRIGFDPPAVNEAESRLTGDLKEINRKPFSKVVSEQEFFPALNQTIEWISKVQNGQTLVPEELKLLQDAGNELAGLAVERPGSYLNTLNDLRKVMSNQTISPDALNLLRRIQKELVLALPSEEISPSPQSMPESELNRDFLNRLTRSSE